MYAYTNVKNHIILKININLPSAYPRVVLVGYTLIILWSIYVAMGALKYCCTFVHYLSQL